MKKNQSIYGLKAINLEKLLLAGFNVPAFITLKNDILPDELLSFIPASLSNKEFFAVRSSSAVEDGNEKSYAGYFYSAIGIRTDKLYEEYRKVVESYKDSPGGVILQEFIPANKSGVLFTNSGNEEIIINANFGLCKPVVEGHACDEYIYSREGEMIHEYIDKNKSALIFEDNEIKNKSKFNFGKVLEQHEIEVLIKTALRIEKFFNCPQDIEWSFIGEELYILQSRPITRHIKIVKDVICYDSANIAESYSGIVLPLTITFAVNIYKTVYINLLKASGASNRKLRMYGNIFNEMVTSFSGRLYYNMNNWYLMMSFIPGYDRNKKNLENMISSNLSTAIHRDISPGIWLILAYPLIVLVKLCVMPLIRFRFLRKVNYFLGRYTSEDIHKMSIDECLKDYKTLSINLLEKWHIPVENDFMVMTYWGILKKKIPEDLLKNYIRFRNISADQIEAVAQLAKLLYKQPDLAQFAESLSVSEIINKMDDFPEIQQGIQKYFQKYGGRFANELKLESPDLEEDREAFVRLLILYKDYQPVHIVEKEDLPDSFFLRYCLRQFKKYASRREEMRLLRSNSFSIVRKLFRQIGNELSNKKLLESSDDVFYLNLEEILCCTDPTINAGFTVIVNSRKAAYNIYKNSEPLPFFSLSEGETVPEYNNEISASEVMHGRSCTPGFVRGKIHVFKEYYLPDIIDFEILVAKHTDPGWTSLIGLSKGMIIEFGGVLSHAAIVSREMAIPTVIGVEGATSRLKTGQVVEINGSTGVIRIISES